MKQDRTTARVLSALVAAAALLACDGADPPVRAKPANRYTEPEPNVPESRRVPLAQAKAGQLVYVPVYSHIYHAGGRPYLLESTLSVRNTDPKASVTFNTVDYYDSNGDRMRSFLAAPLSLGPLQSTEFLVGTLDTSGGAGANFIVEWVADHAVSTPLIECLMAGMSGTHGLSFARPSHVILDKN